MGARLDALHALQDIERQIAAIRRKVEAESRRIKSLKKGVELQDVLVEERTLALRTTQLEIEKLDLDLQSREVMLAKHREALNAAKTNKEYAAILTTINTEKADTAKIEGRQFQYLTDLDEKKARLDAAKAERIEKVARVATIEKALKDYTDEHAEELHRLEKERDAASVDLPQAILDTFRRVAEKHEGEALAPVLIQNAKRNEYACGGCNMSVTLETVLTLQTRDELQMCASCGMILYFGHAASVK